MCCHPMRCYLVRCLLVRCYPVRCFPVRCFSACPCTAITGCLLARARLSCVLISRALPCSFPVRFPMQLSRALLSHAQLQPVRCYKARCTACPCAACPCADMIYPVRCLPLCAVTVIPCAVCLCIYHHSIFRSYCIFPHFRALRDALKSSRAWSNSNLSACMLRASLPLEAKRD